MFFFKSKTSYNKCVHVLIVGPRGNRIHDTEVFSHLPTEQHIYLPWWTHLQDDLTPLSVAAMNMLKALPMSVRNDMIFTAKKTSQIHFLECWSAFATYFAFSQVLQQSIFYSFVIVYWGVYFPIGHNHAMESDSIRISRSIQNTASFGGYWYGYVAQNPNTQLRICSATLQIRKKKLKCVICLPIRKVDVTHADPGQLTWTQSQWTTTTTVTQRSPSLQAHDWRPISCF